MALLAAAADSGCWCCRDVVGGAGAGQLESVVGAGGSSRNDFHLDFGARLGYLDMKNVVVEGRVDAIVGCAGSSPKSFYLRTDIQQKQYRVPRSIMDNLISK